MFTCSEPSQRSLVNHTKIGQRTQGQITMVGQKWTGNTFGSDFRSTFRPFPLRPSAWPISSSKPPLLTGFQFRRHCCSSAAQIWAICKREMLVFGRQVGGYTGERTKHRGYGFACSLLLLSYRKLITARPLSVRKTD